MDYKHVNGRDRGDVKLYAVSTCVWCRKTKRLLEELDVAYDYVDVDELETEAKNEVKDIVNKWKERISYPLLVINNDHCIPNFDEDMIRKEFASSR